MPDDLSTEDRELMDRFFETVLLRYRAGRTALDEAREDLAQAFSAAIAPGDDFRAYMQTVIADDE